MATAEETKKKNSIYHQGESIGNAPDNFSELTQEEQEAWINTNLGTDVSGQVWGLGGTPSASGSGASDGGLMGSDVNRGISDVNVESPPVEPAPAYEPSAEQQAWADMVGGHITDVLEQGGVGIPEETMGLLTQNLTDDLYAKQDDDIRVMRNNMERRGITNSGFIFENEQKIRSNTTKALARGITDLQIQNQLMKMASFENAMGQAAAFLGYLSEQSQLQYAP